MGIQLQILKILAILVLFYATLRKGEDKTGAITAVVMLTIFSLVIRAMDSGIYGVILAFGGILTAIICTAFHYNDRKISSGEFMISAAIGAMVGPAGAAVLFLIVMSLSIAQRLLGADTIRLRDRYAGCLVEPSPSLAGDGYESSREWLGASKRARDTAEEPGEARVPDYARLTAIVIPTLSWGAKLAIAALAVVFSGLFI